MGERVTEVVKYGNNYAVRARKKWVVIKSGSYGSGSIMLSSPLQNVVVLTWQ